VWRSDDGGTRWTNLTEFDGASLLGGSISDLAIAPFDPDVIVVAGMRGLWRSVDAGTSWSGLNENLPSLQISRILDTPGEETDLRVATRQTLEELVWRAGERSGWRIADGARLASERAEADRIGRAVQAQVTTVFRSADVIYAGTADGRIFTSVDRGANWRPSAVLPDNGPVRRIMADSSDPRWAVAITSPPSGGGHVLRTSNGVFWEDVTAGLPQSDLRGISTDRATGAIYVASAAGLYVTYAGADATAVPWQRLREGAVSDVAVDHNGNQLYVAVDGFGVYASLAPHRLRDPRVLTIGERVLRAAAPGALLTVAGARVQSAMASGRAASILAATDSESQIQLPFELPDSRVTLNLRAPTGQMEVGLPVVPAVPSIFVDRDGNGIITDADTGLLLGPERPARSAMRLQVLATGLGRVTPAWLAGVPAPLANPPEVATPVTVLLDGEPLEVSRATLAPGYAGLYVVEFQLPAVLNRGSAELRLRSAGQDSNRVHLVVEP
jgi:uncharacterized protein (TIGR03437 family)